MIGAEQSGHLRGRDGDNHASCVQHAVPDVQRPAFGSAFDPGDLRVLVNLEPAPQRLGEGRHAGGADTAAAPFVVGPVGQIACGFKRAKDDGEGCPLCVDILRAMVELEISCAAGRYAPADAAPFVEHQRGQPCLGQMPRTGQTGNACADHDDGAHARPACCGMRGMFCLTLKKPAVA